MSIKSFKSVLTAAAGAVFVVTSAHAQVTTPNSVKTRIGDLKFERGYPTEETTRKVFDEIDYQRAVQAYLWAYPVVSFESIRIATKRDLGLDYNDFTIAEKLADSIGETWRASARSQDVRDRAGVRLDLGIVPCAAQ